MAGHFSLSAHRPLPLLTKLSMRIGDLVSRLTEGSSDARRPPFSVMKLASASGVRHRDEVRGSYRGLVYIAIYQQERGVVSWSASLEDDDGEVIFVASHFIYGSGRIDCESALRQRIFLIIDDYHRIHETSDLR